ncbi:MAG TPA: TIGR00730 family Rossman fold protein [Bacteroidales bacterium]|nr:TIGR00730 family Rossman fold protein [Bacteroidales bacterium]HNS46084.1 TIGR00730 family Rossman fold protein [Bacteroidales bacterium]
MKKLGVFCGSSMGGAMMYREKAAELGEQLARRQITLVFGGANIGLMKALADGVLHNGGRVIGVMPQILVEKEILHESLNEVIIVDSMHERKARMAGLADAFMALPGGFGTLDELAEILSWNQLEVISKPLALFNVNNYFGHLIRFLDHCVDERFLRIEHRNNILVGEDCTELLDRLATFIPVQVHSKWVDELKLM